MIGYSSVQDSIFKKRRNIPFLYIHSAKAWAGHGQQHKGQGCTELRLRFDGPSQPVSWDHMLDVNLDIFLYKNEVRILTSCCAW